MSPRKQTTPGDPTKAVGYVRVSTEDQNLGPEAQREQLARFCKAQKLELVAVYTDHGISGAADLDKRPGLLDALAALDSHGAGVLLVAKRDRLARDVVKAGLVEQLTQTRGARVVSADGVSAEDTPEGQLMRVLMDAFAQYERAQISARTRAALAVKKTKGELTGSAPYGKRVAADGVRLLDNKREARAIKEARKLRRKGLALRAIGAELAAKGHKPRGGATWHPQTVSNLLRG